MAPPTRLDADAPLQLEVRQGGQRAVLFELSRFLQIKQVEADGQPVEFIHNQALEGTQLARRGNDLVAVIFPQPLRAGQKIELHFVYGGEVLSEAGAGSAVCRSPRDVVSEPWAGDGQIRFAIPLSRRLDAACDRKAGGRRPLRTCRRANNPAIGFRIVPCRWLGFNLGKYSRVVAQAGTVAVEAYATSGVERTFPQGHDPGAGFTSSLSCPFHESRDRRAVTVTAPPPSPARNAQAVADYVGARGRVLRSAASVPIPTPAWLSPKCPAMSVRAGLRLSSSPAFPFSRPQEKTAFAYESGGQDPER